MTETVIAEAVWAVTERGRSIQHTEQEVDAILRLLVANGGRCTITSEQLAEEGMAIDHQSLQRWRDRSFPYRYAQLRAEMGKEVAEKIAGNAMERAMEADEAEKVYIEEAARKVSKVHPNHLAKGALALATAKGHSIEKAQLLRSQPTEIKRVDLSESIAVLERLGVIEKPIDAEVVEESDA